MWQSLGGWRGWIWMITNDRWCLIVPPCPCFLVFRQVHCFPANDRSQFFGTPILLRCCSHLSCQGSQPLSPARSFRPQGPWSPSRPSATPPPSPWTSWAWRGCCRRRRSTRNPGSPWERRGKTASTWRVGTWRTSTREWGVRSRRRSMTTQVLRHHEYLF